MSLQRSQLCMLLSIQSNRIRYLSKTTFLAYDTFWKGLLLMESISLPRITADIPGLRSNQDDESLSSLCPELSYTERLIGFGACMLMASLITLSSFGSFSQLLVGRPLRFAVLYSLGNLTSLCSTLFLVGPKRQYQNMTSPARKVSAGIYVFCLFTTLLTAYLVPQLTWLIVTLILIQWSALVWYTLSYIPFGRRIARGLANRLLV